MSSPKTHAFPCNIASVENGEVVDFGAEGVRGEEDNDGGGEGDSGRDEDAVVVVSSAVKLQIPLRTCDLAFYCRGGRSCGG